MDGALFQRKATQRQKNFTSTKVQGLVHVEINQFEGKDGAVTPVKRGQRSSRFKDWQGASGAAPSDERWQVERTRSMKRR